MLFVMEGRNKETQFERFTNPERYVYTKHGSKNRNGGFYQLDVENKNVEIYKNTTDGKHCLVSLLDLYLISFQNLPKLKIHFIVDR